MTNAIYRNTQVEEDTRIDMSVLVNNSLLHETSGAYWLHDLTHEYLQLLNRMDSRLLPSATCRQAKFLARAATLHEYANDVSAAHGGLYALMKLWATLSHADSPMRAWEYISRVPEAKMDETYMSEAGRLLILMVRAES